jgi:uncharacterized membrane protein
MATTLDPYAIPKSHVADVPHSAPDGDFLPNGQGVGIGNGWTWISEAWSLFEGNRAVAIGIFIIFAVLSVLPSLVPIAGPLAVYLLMPVLSGGVMLGCDALRRGEKLEVGHLFAGFSKNTGRLVGVGAFVLVAFIAIFALVFLIFGAGMLGIFTGGMLGEQPDPEQITAVGLTIVVAVLVMFGLSLPIYMALWFAPSLVVLNEMKVGAALKASFFGCLKNILPFLVWSVVFFVLAILATVPLLLGWLLLGPVMLGSLYTSYRDVFYSH